MSTGGGFLSGRLGLSGSRIPHANRHGLLWLSRGRLSVEDGTLRFVCSDSEDLATGDYAIPYQGLSMILLGPGCSITHDVLRVLARHGTLLAAIGGGGPKVLDNPTLNLERILRRDAASEFRKRQLVPKTIDRIKELLDADDNGGDP